MTARPSKSHGHLPDLSRRDGQAAARYRQRRKRRLPARLHPAHQSQRPALQVRSARPRRHQLRGLPQDHDRRAKSETNRSRSSSRRRATGHRSSGRRTSSTGCSGDTIPEHPGNRVDRRAPDEGSARHRSRCSPGRSRRRRGCARVVTASICRSNRRTREDRSDSGRCDARTTSSRTRTSNGSTAGSRRSTPRFRRVRRQACHMSGQRRQRPPRRASGRRSRPGSRSPKTRPIPRPSYRAPIEDDHGGWRRPRGMPGAPGGPQRLRRHARAQRVPCYVRSSRTPRCRLAARRLDVRFGDRLARRDRQRPPPRRTSTAGIGVNVAGRTG